MAIRCCPIRSRTRWFGRSCSAGGHADSPDFRSSRWSAKSDLDRWCVALGSALGFAAVGLAAVRPHTIALGSAAVLLPVSMCLWRVDRVSMRRHTMTVGMRNSN